MPLPVVGYLLGQNWLTVLLVAGFLPLADVVIGKDRSNPSRVEEARLLRNPQALRLSRLGLYAYVPVHVALIAWGAWVFAHGQLPAGQSFGLLLSVGLVTGGQGITIAHELGHSRSGMDRLLARLLLVFVGYGHFYIEHNRGHHARVATPDDPATSRLGESLYRFLPRAIIGSLASAWRLEAERLRRRRQDVINVRNQMLWLTGAPLLVAFAISTVLGAPGLLFFAGQCVVAFTLLEAVNYVEHYGLLRGRTSGGTPERVSFRHSWNASERLSNMLLFNLQRHADHHANPTRPYSTLRHREESPQLPTGYPGMLLLALVPRLWFHVMDSKVVRMRTTMANAPERKGMREVGSSIDRQPESENVKCHPSPTRSLPAAPNCVVGRN